VAIRIRVEIGVLIQRLRLLDVEDGKLKFLISKWIRRFEQKGGTAV
jgi:hypothetical protein